MSKIKDDLIEKQEKKEKKFNDSAYFKKHSNGWIEKHRAELGSFERSNEISREWNANPFN